MKKYIIFSAIITLMLAGICTVGYSAESDPYGELVSQWDTPPVMPPKNTHPRVYFTQNDIPRIKENIKDSENAYAAKLMNSYLSYKPEKNAEYNTTALAAIETKAFYYAVYKTGVTGGDASDWIDAIETSEVPGILDSCRLYGRMINVLAEVYDWCYDILGNEDKERIIKLCIDYGYRMEMGWPPSKQGAVTGHGSEAQLLRDYMSFAIAVCDERPDIWNYIGGRFYAEYVPAREFSNAGHYNHQGTNYGFYREVYTSTAYMLITGMGADEPYSIDALEGTALSEIYMKRPDGQVFYDGDIYTGRTAPFNYYSCGSKPENDSMLIRAAKSGNGYLKGEYLKRIQRLSNGEIIQEYGDSSPVLHLILNSSALKAKTTETLPTAKYFGSPYGIMSARTSWQEGTASGSVAAFMKIGEYMFNNHQHLDSGNFEIYYKGLLAAEGGKYDIYGTAEHYMYTSKTIAHNCMLVYDPNEAVRGADGSITESRSNITDGGQRAVNNYGEVTKLEHVTDKPGLKHAEISAHEIDPRHTQNPEYTYLKGDLTDSYTDKVQKYTRSFMFLDLKDADIPAALIVFDYVKSSDKTFKKTWLLHSLQKPVINDGSTVFENTLSNGEEDYSGKMELKTLLPLSGNLNRTIVGGEDEGFGIINQYKYQNGEWKITESKNYSADNTEGTESNTYRLEVSPKTAAEEDYFLNIITVGDSGKDISVSAPLINTDGFYGTIVKDRAVFFGKNKGDNTAFAATLPGGSYKYTICDMQQGEYAVIAGGKAQTVYASADGGVLSFEASGGKINVIKTGTAYKAPADTPYTTEESTVYVKKGSRFLKQALAEFDEENISVSVGAFADTMGYSIKAEGDTYIIEKDGAKAASVTAGKKSVITQNGILTLSAEPYKVNDVLYIRPDDLYRIMGFSGCYLPYARTVYLNSSGGKTGMTANAYRVGDTIRVNARTGSIYTAEPFCAAYDGTGKLVCGAKMTDLGGGRYTALIDNAGAAESIKIFPWAEDLTPFSVPFELNNYNADNILGVRNSSDGTFWYTSARVGVDVESDSAGGYRITKSGTQQESSIHGSFGTHYIDEDKLIFFSAAIKINKKGGAGEKVQIRLRGQSALSSTFAAFNMPSEEGDEYRISMIADLKDKKARFYVNGVLGGTYSLENWINADGTPGRVNGIEFYFVSSEGLTGGEYEVWDSSTTIFGEGTSVEEIESRINNFYIK